MGERTGAYRILVGRSEVRRPLGRPRWKDNIKIDLKWDGGIWTGCIWLWIGKGGETVLNLLLEFLRNCPMYKNI